MIIEKYKLVREWVLNPRSKITKVVNGDESEIIKMPKPVQQYLIKKGFKKITTSDGKGWIWEKLGFAIDINGSFDVDLRIYSNGFFIVVFSDWEKSIIHCIVFDNVMDKTSSDCIGGFAQYWSKSNLTIQELSKLI